MCFIVLRKNSISYVDMHCLLVMVMSANIHRGMSFLRLPIRELHRLIYRSDKNDGDSI